MTELDPNVYAVILAGGSGTRFWPRSRQKMPKQLCHIGDPSKTLIEKTLERLDGFIPPSRRLVVTHRAQVEQTKKVVKDTVWNFIAEPEARNTAAALAAAAFEIKKLHDESQNSAQPAIMISLHADHVIANADQFRRDLCIAVEAAKNDKLVLLGVTPTYPETGYGYIERGEALRSPQGAWNVAAFREKPDFETAKKYLASGRYVWNAGYFIWKTDVLLSELQSFLPNTYNALKNLSVNKRFSDVSESEFSAAYSKLSNVSIDNAVLECSSHVAMVPTSCGWFDVGSWDALQRCFGSDERGNHLEGASSIFAKDTSNTTISTHGPFVASIGVENLIIVAEGDAVLVCDRSRAQDVKDVVAYLKSVKRHDLI